MHKELLAESITVRVSLKEKKNIQDYANKHHISYSEAIRVLCRKALENKTQTEVENYESDDNNHT